MERIGNTVKSELERLMREYEIAADNTDDNDAPHVPNTEWQMMLDAGEKR